MRLWSSFTDSLEKLSTNIFEAGIPLHTKCSRRLSKVCVLPLPGQAITSTRGCFVLIIDFEELFSEILKDLDIIITTNLETISKCSKDEKCSFEQFTSIIIETGLCCFSPIYDQWTDNICK